MSKWWMPDNGTAAVGIHNSDGGWLADAAYRCNADKLVAAHNADCDTYEAKIDAMRTEVDELQRRLDAVCKMLEPGEKPCRCIDEYGPDENCDWCADRDHYLDSCEWHQRYTLHARAVAIAEGRES